MIYASQRKHQNGFSLVELSITLIIIGVLAAAALQAYNSYYQNRLIQKTTENIEYVNDRIAGFVEEHGFYPCPAAPSDPSGVATNCSAPPLGSVAGVRDPATGLIWNKMERQVKLFVLGRFL
jgi:prepilin-type N-terminal cleavage/methylation domain-containing protein